MDNKDLELEKEQWERDFSETFSTPQGRRVLVWLTHQLYVFRPYKQFNAGSYAQQGKREVGVEIAEILGWSEVIRLTQEAVKQEIKR